MVVGDTSTMDSLLPVYQGDANAVADEPGDDVGTWRGQEPGDRRGRPYIYASQM
jgi:hypothetical protein